MGVRHLFQLWLAIALLRNAASTVTECKKSGATTLDDVAKIDAKTHVTDAACTGPNNVKCETIYTKAGKVTLELKCGPATCSASATNTKVCEQCGSDKCNTVVEAVKTFSKCPSYNGAAGSLSATVPAIYCAGDDTQKKCLRQSYKSTSSSPSHDNIFIGCGPDCHNRASKVDPTVCEEIMQCPTDAGPVDFIDSKTLTYCATKDATTACHGKLSGTPSNGSKVQWTLGCGACSGAAITKGTNCFECDTTGCSIAASIDPKKLTKCNFYEGEKSKQKIQTIYCSGEVKCAKLEWKDGGSDHIWMGCSADCAAKTTGPASSATCEEIAPPTIAPTSKPGSTDKSGATDKSADDGKKKRSSRLLPGTATLLALSLLAALL